MLCRSGEDTRLGEYIHIIDIMLFSDHSLARRIEAIDTWGIMQCVETQARLQPEVGAAALPVADGLAAFVGAHSPITSVVNLGMNSAVTAEDMEKAESFFRERGANVSVKLCPFAHPSLLPLLNERGYHPVELTSILFRSIASEECFPSPPPSILLSIAEPFEEELWYRTVGQGFAGDEQTTTLHDDIGRIIFNQPLSTCLLARADGQVAGGAAMSSQDGTAALFGSSVLPKFRNRGVHAALIAARLAIIAKSGCDLVRFETAPGSTSQRNAERLGFRVAYTRVWMEKKFS
jgi:GNAT superfamily N-acetyltransferase